MPGQMPRFACVQICHCCASKDLWRVLQYTRKLAQEYGVEIAICSPYVPPVVLRGESTQRSGKILVFCRNFRTTVHNSASFSCTPFIQAQSHSWVDLESDHDQKQLKTG